MGNGRFHQRVGCGCLGPPLRVGEDHLSFPSVSLSIMLAQVKQLTRSSTQHPTNMS